MSDDDDDVVEEEEQENDDYDDNDDGKGVSGFKVLRLYCIYLLLLEIGSPFVEFRVMIIDCDLLPETTLCV